MNKEKKGILLHLKTVLISIVCIVCILFSVGVFTRIIGTGVAKGNSSYPTSATGDFEFMVSSSIIDYGRGDFVSIFGWYEAADIDCVNKRIVGLPGETVEIIDDVVYINDQPLDEPYKYTEGDGLIGTTWSKITLGDDEYFVMGDNRRTSLDSRSLGPVKKNQIKYTVVFIFGDWKIKYNYFDKD